MKKNKSSILIIYTGGTIGMKEDPADNTLKPFDFSQILKEVPELSKFACRIDSYSFSPVIDSSDIEPSMWVKLVEIIREKYCFYDGFVILHGTDTMSYSASAISFMIDNLTKPVVFTGSQLPIGVPRTDGKENLISAVEIASAKDDNGRAMVPEVCVYFDCLLMRANRTSKMSSDNFNAFGSPNFPPLTEAGITIRYNTSLIRRPADPDAGPVFKTALDTRVSILKIHPGITPEVVGDILCGPGTRAVIIETYGSGNAPSAKWFLDMVIRAHSMGKVLLNVTQCPSGTVNMNIYATGKSLQKAGVVNGCDSTTESALAKLFVLMGEYGGGTEEDRRCIERELSRDLKGEITC